MNSWKQTVAAAIVMGLVAAAVVWYLERFQSIKLHEEVNDYLRRYDRFKLWEAEHSGDS